MEHAVAPLKTIAMPGAMSSETTPECQRLISEAEFLSFVFPPTPKFGPTPK
jgi:hypothetical protein